MFSRSCSAQINGYPETIVRCHLDEGLSVTKNCIPVLANKALSICIVHSFHEGAFVLRCHGRLTDPKHAVYATE
jgi:hypothetical protein